MPFSRQYLFLFLVVHSVIAHLESQEENREAESTESSQWLYSLPVESCVPFSVKSSASLL